MLSSSISKYCIFFCLWHLAVVNGHVKRPQDEDIQSNVLEIVGSNVQSTYITCPADPAATLGIKLPFLVMIVKNLKQYFTFEIQVLDDKNVRRRFRASNFQVCKSSLFPVLVMLYLFSRQFFVLQSMLSVISGTSWLNISLEEVFSWQKCWLSRPFGCPPE